MWVKIKCLRAHSLVFENVIGSLKLSSQERGWRFLFAAVKSMRPAGRPSGGECGGPALNQERVGSLHSLPSRTWVCSSELSPQQNLRHTVPAVSFIGHPERWPVFLFHKIKEEGTLSNLFYAANSIFVLIYFRQKP